MMEKIIVLILIFFFTITTSFAREKANVKTTVQGNKVIHQKGTWEEVEYKIPFEKIHVFLWENDEDIQNKTEEIQNKVRELGTIDKYYQQTDNPYRFLIQIIGTTDYFDSNTSAISVYDDSDYLGTPIYYNLVDSGIYAGGDILDIKDEKVIIGKVGDEIIQTASRWQFYRIGKGKFEKGVLYIWLPNGAWVSYRKKAIFSWGKDSDQITFYVPGIFREPDLIFDLGFYKNVSKYKMLKWEGKFAQ